jgi:hypothetical protein
MNGTPSPVELAFRLRAGDESPEVLQWVRRGLRRHLDDPRRNKLQVALGLTEAARKKHAFKVIREIGELLDVEGCGSWEKAHRIETAIAYYETRVLPMQDKGCKPIDTPLNALLAMLFRLQVLFPRTQTGIHDGVLKK